MAKPKPLNNYKKAELLAAVDHFEVTLDESDNTNFEIIKKLKDAGVTPEQMSEFTNPASEPEETTEESVVDEVEEPVEEEKETVPVLENKDGEKLVADGELTVSVAPADEVATGPFSKYSTEELREIALAFGVDFTEDDSDKVLVDNIEEDGVREQDWIDQKARVAAAEAEKEEAEKEQEETPEPVPVEDAEDDDLVLVKMTRLNYSYEVRGYEFSRTHPYGLVKEKDVDFLIEEEGGFAMASPSEVRAYYS